MQRYSDNSYLTTPPFINEGSCESYSVKLNDFQPPPPSKLTPITQYLIIGFDTEYVRGFVDESLEGFENEVKPSNTILSYQYSCQIIDVDRDSDANKVSWNGIVLPKSGEDKDRLKFEEFIHIALGDGLKKYPDIQIPYHIFLVAHFTRADVPAFAEFKKDIDSRLALNLDALRKSFVNLKKDIKVNLITEEDEQVERSVKIRDSLHLAPTGKQKLDDLGELLGFKKLKVGKDFKQDRFYKENMDKLLEDDWELFREYAITDAIICVKWIEEIIRINQDNQDKFALPATLTSVGVQLLQKYWKDNNCDPLEMVGKEEVKIKKYNKRTGKYYTTTITPYKTLLDNNITFLTNCYHGGRNEQFWFGVSPRTTWYDYDLTSAYPSAMCLLGIPQWDAIKPIVDLDSLLYQGEYKKTGEPRYRYPAELVFGQVRFEFPESVRFPCLPVRQETGVLFPRKGVCQTHICEIILAHQLGAKLEFEWGVEIPSKRHKLESNEFLPFRDFTKFCVEKRGEYKKGEVKNLFWKELVNSTYGKTAQGLQVRRIYDLSDRDMKELVPSTITNPVFASFITAFCRATLGEVMNNFAKEVMVFSVTTDGFLTNATPKQLEEASGGLLCKYYRSARKLLTDAEQEIFEVKHIAKQLIGWRTRSQSTLIPSTPDDWQDIDGDGDKEDNRYVLAKGGIKLPYKDKLTKQQEVNEINKWFFNRKPEDTYTQIAFDSYKDMFEDGTDFVDKQVVKRLSMEFDWKRKPHFVGECAVDCEDVDVTKHLFFSTTTWEDVNDFHDTKRIWEEYNVKSRKNLKTIEDYNNFREYHSSKVAVLNTENDSMVGKYLKREDGIQQRIRQQIAIAQSRSAAGTIRLSDELIEARGVGKVKMKELATWLQVVLEIDVVDMDLYNDRKKERVERQKRNNKEFIPHLIPNTPLAHHYLNELREMVFPDLDIEMLVSREGRFNIGSCEMSEFVEFGVFKGFDEEANLFQP